MVLSNSSSIDEEELLQLQDLVEGDVEGDSADEDWPLSSDSDLQEEMETELPSEQPEMPSEQPGMQSQNQSKKKTNLSNMQRKHIVQKLLSAEDKKKSLPRGIFSELAAEYQCCRTTISRLWKDAKSQRMEGNLINVNSKRKGRCGRKCREFNDEALQAVPLHKRTTIRSYASALQVSPSMVYRLLQKGRIRSHSNSIKPKLEYCHRKQRILWVLKHIIPRTLNTKAVFEGLYNYVHIDEKWFYLNQKTMKFYLLAKEEDPYRSTQNKNYILKVMFMAAVARPVFDDEREVIWDGKIGIFPFTEIVIAQRRSSNRDRGTAEIKAVQKITREVIRQKLINEVIPCIKERWPANASKNIIIQQDKAKPHMLPNDDEFNAIAQMDGFNFTIVNQPPQSPDLNILDLGFFRAIQSLQHQECPKNVEELVKAVNDQYQAFDPKLLNYTWLHLQYVMLEILKHKDHNNYKNPHVGKHKLDRIG